MDSSLTNGTYAPSSLTYTTVNIIFKFDAVLRISSAFIHLFYFFLIFKIEKMRKKSLIYLHHSILIGFLFNLHYLIYFDFVHPNFNNQTLNNIVCAISEQIWTMLKNLRTYSIALIALYRLIGVFKHGLYKKINRSIYRVLFLLLLVYVWVIIILLATKYGFNTTYGYLYCFDGFSTVLKDSFYYFLVQSIVGIAFPTVFSVIAYIFIRKRLIESEVKAKKIKFYSGDPLKVCGVDPLMKICKQYEIAKQFFIINLCEIMSCLMVIGLGMRYLFPNLNDYYNVTRFLLRFFNLFFQAIIPITAIVYHPILYSACKKWFNNLMLFFISFTLILSNIQNNH